MVASMNCLCLYPATCDVKICCVCDHGSPVRGAPLQSVPRSIYHHASAASDEWGCHLLGSRKSSLSQKPNECRPFSIETAAQ
jgi:hypothetical protein